jgi:hypothetical protein
MTPAKAVCIALLLATSIAGQPMVWADDTIPVAVLDTAPAVTQQHLAAPANTPSPAPKRAEFGSERVSEPARHTANWVVDSGDNLSMPFMIIDKAQARVLMFDASGRLTGAASALLGMAVGDDSVPGIGERSLSSILPEERTTPAGRFVASLGRNLAGREILWIDYGAAISLHRVAVGNAKERRLERLASPHLDDKRISYGCVNVPVASFENVVMPAFSGTDGVVYTLPETRPNQSVFNAYYESGPE